MHLGINMVTLAAFGAPVERLLGVRRFVLFYLSAGVVAGFIHVLFFPDFVDPVIGASGAISGVFGGVLMLMRYVGSLTSLLPVAGIWIALNVFFGIFGGTPGGGGEQVAWAAHIGGFVYGLVGHPPVPAAPSASAAVARTSEARRHGRPAGPAAPLPRRPTPWRWRRPSPRSPSLYWSGDAGGPAGADRHGRHRRRHDLPGAALPRLAGPLRALRRRAVGRARAGDAAPLLCARHRGAGDGGGHALDRLAPPARLDRQSRGLGAGHRRRPARSADRRRPPAPHRAHQPRGARRCSAPPAPSATSRRCSAIRSCWPRSTALLETGRRQLHRARPDRGRARAVRPARARRHRPCCAACRARRPTARWR